ncbi:MAG: biotin--[acetyl-CoA-carboxylase] ligase [Actinomycetota bacterium]
MLSERDLSHALERIGAEAPVRFDEVTRSTQLTALALAGAGAPEWTLVAAAHQTEGRGRLGREWIDEPGRALLFSVVLRPELAPSRGGLLTLLAGWAMAAACRDVASTDAACKWPNDVLVGGRKAGGILAESRLLGRRFEHVVLGLGLNLGAAPTSVPGSAAIRGADPAAVLGAFLETFASRYAPADRGFPGSVVGAYRGICETLGRRVRAVTTAGRTVEGEAVDLDEAGGLVVRTTAGLETVRFGEIEHLAGGDG